MVCLTEQDEIIVPGSTVNVTFQFVTSNLFSIIQSNS